MIKEVFCKDCRYYEFYHVQRGKKIVGMRKTPVRNETELCEYDKHNKNNNCEYYEGGKNRGFWDRVFG